MAICIDVHIGEYMYGCMKNYMNTYTYVYMYYLLDRSSCKEKEKKTTEINEISISQDWADSLENENPYCVNVKKQMQK